MNRKINYRRIIANSLEVFFASTLGLMAGNSLFNVGISVDKIVMIALLPSMLQGLIIACHEWGTAEESKNSVHKSSVSMKTKFFTWKNLNRLLNVLVVG